MPDCMAVWQSREAPYLLPFTPLYAQVVPSVTAISESCCLGHSIMQVLENYISHVHPQGPAHTGIHGRVELGGRWSDGDHMLRIPLPLPWRRLCPCFQLEDTDKYPAWDTRQPAHLNDREEKNQNLGMELGEAGLEQGISWKLIFIIKVCMNVTFYSIIHLCLFTVF